MHYCFAVFIILILQIEKKKTGNLKNSLHSNCQKLSTEKQVNKQSNHSSLLTNCIEFKFESLYNWILFLDPVPKFSTPSAIVLLYDPMPQFNWCFHTSQGQHDEPLPCFMHICTLSLDFFSLHVTCPPLFQGPSHYTSFLSDSADLSGFFPSNCL